MGSRIPVIDGTFLTYVRRVVYLQSVFVLYGGIKRTKTTINQEEVYVRKFYRRTDYDELLPI